MQVFYQRHKVPYLNQGATFSFQFLLPFSTEKRKKPRNIDELQHNLSGHILIVDDAATNLLVGKTMLNKFGITVDTAVNGEEAVKCYQNTAYDLILMDCRMPVMDGYNASKNIRQLEQQGQHIPIIALTANTSKEEKEMCCYSGMDNVLTKPYQKNEIYNMLRKYL